MEQSTVAAVVGSPVIVNGDEYENIELKQSGSDILSSHSGTAVVVSVAGTPGGAVKRDVDNNISAADPSPPLRAAPTSESGVVQSTDAERQRDSSSGYTSESGDMLRELVKNKDQIEVPHRKPPVKMGSADSEVSDTSNLASSFLTCFLGLMAVKEQVAEKHPSQLCGIVWNSRTAY